MERGSVFAGYTILGELGRGGMGTVYLARHPRLPRNVALKLLARDHVADQDSLRRFEREAEMIAALDHPGIVTVFDRGSVDGHPWLTMRYVEGTDASRLRAEDLPLPRAARIVRDIAGALDYAHRRNVLHRDIKPANILLTVESGAERALLSDFGIALPGNAATHLTATGTINATLAYASPEQLTGAPLDGRADQYSLACTLFRMLTGRTPFVADDAVALIAGHLQLDPPAPSTYRRDVPRALDEAIGRALAKRPEDRFPSCSEFAAAVAAAIDVPAARLPAEPRPAAAVPVPSTGTVGSRQRATVRTPARTVVFRRWQAALAIAAVVVLGVGSGLAVVKMLGVDSITASASVTTTSSPAKTTTKPVTAADTAEAERASDLLRITFPAMVPTVGSKTGYLGTTCSSMSKVIVPRGMSSYKIDFGDWVSAWDCLGGNGNRCCAYHLVAYRTPADVQSVVDRLPASTRYADSSDGMSAVNYRFSTPNDTKGVAEITNLITTFPGDPVRGTMLMYAAPLFENSAATRDEMVKTMTAWWRDAPLT
ncbi:serine/threonine-protein kinase [Nocardia asteroides]|uniref:serine/threonine-protein kinase n=1 Tax=Nocardia asteroides TaxID=1824 RepID=UPI00342EBECB